MTPSRSRALARISSVAVATLLGLSACSSSHPSSPSTASQGGVHGKLTVWTDAVRKPGFEKFAQTHPAIKLKISLYNEGTIYTKLQLFNRTGSGWPDVIAGTPGSADPYYKFGLRLDDKIPASVQSGFGSANRPCMIDGKLYCLVNDISQEVLWYDSVQMKKFGYQIPTTWDQYEALGLRVAKEHPGYVIGDAGDSFVYYDYFMSSGCPIQDIHNNTAHFDMSDQKCTRVATMLDTLLKAGALGKSGWSSPEFTALAKSRKVLMQPMASWFGEFVVKPAASYAWPAGVLAVAPLPGWQGEAKAYSANPGGIVYVVSKHAKDQAAAIELAQWMATSPDNQVSAPTWPAYQPAAKMWAAARKYDTYFASDPSKVLEQAVELINPVNVNSTRYIPDPPFTDVIVPAIRSGKSVLGVLSKVQTEYTNLAKSVGYAVN